VGGTATAGYHRADGDAASILRPVGAQRRLVAGFFGLRQPLGALIIIAALFAAILLTMRAFARVDRAAAWLLAPYAAWVGFAAYLNAGVWWLNRG